MIWSANMFTVWSNLLLHLFRIFVNYTSFVFVFFADVLDVLSIGMIIFGRAVGRGIAGAARILAGASPLISNLHSSPARYRAWLSHSGRWRSTTWRSPQDTTCTSRSVPLVPCAYPSSRTRARSSSSLPQVGPRDIQHTPTAWTQINTTRPQHGTGTRTKKINSRTSSF